MLSRVTWLSGEASNRGAGRRASAPTWWPGKNGVADGGARSRSGSRVAEHALALPKVDSPEHVRAIGEILDERETERGMMLETTRLIAMGETPAALFGIADIARADPCLVRLSVGAEDFALSFGILPEAEGLFMPKQLCVFATRAAGILPLGFIGTVAEFPDLDGFHTEIVVPLLQQVIYA